MRHAKSDWGGGASGDHARQLNKRGRRSAPLIAAELQRIGWAPEVVISSDAQRTQETWEHMWGTFEQVEPAFTRELYLAGLEAITPLVSRVPAAIGTVMVLGHNPGFSHAVELLTGAPAELTTANAALMAIEAESWKAAIGSRGAWRLDQILRPRELEA